MAQYSSSQFATEIRRRYPGSYDSWDDDSLAVSMAAKHPAYKSWVDWTSLRPESRGMAVQTFGDDPESQAMLGTFPLRDLPAEMDSPYPGGASFPAAPSAPAQAPAAEIPSQLAPRPSVADRLDPNRLRPSVDQVVQASVASAEAEADRQAGYALQRAQEDWDRRKASGLVPTVRRPVLGGLLGNNVTFEDNAEPRPTETSFAASQAGVSISPSQQLLGDASHLLRDAVSPVTNLVTGRGEGVENLFNEPGRKGRAIRQQSANFSMQKAQDDLEAKRAAGTALSPEEQVFLEDMDQGVVASTVDFFRTLATDPEARADMVEIMGSEAPLSILTAPIAEAGVARLYMAMKNLRRTYALGRRLRAMRAAEAAGQAPPGFSDRLASRFASSRASLDARTGMADALAPGDSRAVKNVSERLGVSLAPGTRRTLAEVASEAPAEAFTEGAVGTATGYGRGENRLDAKSLAQNIAQEGLMEAGVGVPVAASRAASVPAGLSIEDADAAVGRLDLRPWVQADAAPTGVSRPTKAGERAGVSSVPAAQKAQAHPRFQSLMSRIAAAAKRPELQNQRFRISGDQPSPELPEQDMARAGYAANTAGGQIVRGYSLPEPSGGSTAVVTRAGDESTLAHELIHGVERQAESDPALMVFRDQINSWKSAATAWARENGYDVPDDPASLRRYQSELFTRAMNDRLGGSEDEIARTVPMPDRLVQSFAQHAGDAVRSGEMRSRGDGREMSESVPASSRDMEDIPYSLLDDEGGAARKPRPDISMDEGIRSSPRDLTIRMAKLWDAALSSRGPSNFSMPLGRPNVELKAAIRKVLGDKSEIREQRISLGQVRHIQSRHGTGQEGDPSQVPITKKIFSLIPHVLENFDSVEAGKLSRKSQAVLIKKTYSDGRIVIASAIVDGGTLDIRTIYAITPDRARFEDMARKKGLPPLGDQLQRISSGGLSGSWSGVQAPELNVRNDRTFPAAESNIPRNPDEIKGNEEKKSADSDSAPDLRFSLKPKSEQQQARLKLIKVALNALRKEGIFVPIQDLSAQWGREPGALRSEEEKNGPRKQKWTRALDAVDLAIHENPDLVQTAGASGASAQDVIKNLSDWARGMGRAATADGWNGMELRAMRDPDSLPFEWPESDRRLVSIADLMDEQRSGYISVLANGRMYVRRDRGEYVVRDSRGNEDRLDPAEMVWVDAATKAVSPEAMASTPTRQWEKDSKSSPSNGRLEPVLDWAPDERPDLRDTRPSPDLAKGASAIFEALPSQTRQEFADYVRARDALALHNFALDQEMLARMDADSRSRQEQADVVKMTKPQALRVVTDMERRPDFQQVFAPKYQELLALRERDLRNGAAEPEPPASSPAQATRPLKNEKTGTPLTDDSFLVDRLSQSGAGNFLSRPERFYSAAVDEAYPIEKVQKLYDAAHGATAFAESLGAKVDQVRGSAGVAKAHSEATLDPIYAGGRYLVHEGNQTRAVKLSRLNPSQMQALDRYLVAKTALWRYENNGLTDAEAPGDPRFKFSDPYLTQSKCRTWITAVEARGDFKELEQRARMMWKFHRDLSLMKLDAGHWTPALYEQVTRDPFYVPLIRDTKSAYASVSTQAGKGPGRYTSSDDLLRGHYVLDRQVPYARPYVASRMDEEATFAEVAKANVARGVVDLARRDPGGIGLLIQKLEDGEQPGAGTMVVSVVEDGRVVRYKVDDELGQYIQGMGPYMPANAVARLLISANNFWKGMTTSWNPDFSAANVTRDIQESLLNTNLAGIRGLLQYLGHDLPVGFWEAVTQGPMYQGYRLGGGMMDPFDVRQGGAGSTDDALYGGLWAKVRDPAYYVAEAHPRLVRSLDALRAAGRGASNLLGAIGQVSEMTTRLAMYQRVKRSGGSDAEAIRAARQGTLDFQRHGTMGKSFNAFLPFFNAAIQGTDKTARTLMATDFAGRGKARAAEIAKRLAKASAFGAVPTVALTMWNSDHEEYGNIPISEREANWIFMLRGANYLKVPKSAWQKLAFNSMQTALEQILGVTTSAASPLWQTTLRSLAGAMPVGDVAALVPPLAKTVLEEATNQDLYFRSPIWNENVDPRLQISPWTSDTMKKLGWALEMSPARMEHILRGVLGGNTQNALFVADLALSSRDDVAFPKPKRVPFLKRFYGQAQEWGGDLEKAERDVMRAIRAAQGDGRKELKRQYAAELRRASAMEASGDSLGARQVRFAAQQYVRVQTDYVRSLVRRRKEIVDARKALDSMRNKLADQVEGK